jgi:hypothetical protein
MIRVWLRPVLGLLVLDCGGSSGGSSDTHSNAVTGSSGGRAAGASGSPSAGIAGTSGSPGTMASSMVFGSATAAELEAICTAHKSDLTSLALSACLVDGLGESTAAACETKRSACTADPTKTTIDCSKSDPKSLQGCSVTVGEFESCLTELVGYFGMLSCADAGKTPPIPPSCYASLMSRCQSIFSPSSS